MSQTKLHQLVALFLTAFLLMAAPVVVLAQDAGDDTVAEDANTDDATAEADAEADEPVEESAEEQPAASAVRAKVVTGSLPGNQFAQTWLQLVPDFPDATIKIMVDWSVPNAGSKGLQFAVLDPGTLNRVIGGSALNDVSAIAKGNSVFQGSDNQMEATFRAGGLTNYTLIMINDGSTDATFTLSVESSTIVDESGQVMDSSMSMVDDAEMMDDSEAMVEDAESAPATAPANTALPAAANPAPAASAPASASGVVIPPGLPIPAYYYDKPEFYIQYIDPALLAGANTAPAAATTTVVGDIATADDADNDTETDVAEESDMDEAMTNRSVRAEKLQGALSPDSIHYLGLMANVSDGNISLDLTFEPQDSREINIFVVNESDLALLNSGNRLSDVAFSAGNRVSNGPQNLRNANFRSSGLGRYTVLVRNSSTSASAEYTLNVEGGMLSDDSGQTSTSQTMDEMEEMAEDDDSMAASTAAAPAPATSAPVVAPSVAVQTTTAAPAPVAVSPAPAQTTAPAAAPTSVALAPTTGARAGAAYTIKSGDSISKIARDVYDDVKLFTQICEFNRVSDCNRVEVGDTLRLPTQAEMTSLSGGTTLTAPAAAPAATTSTSRTTTPPTTASRTSTTDSATTDSAITSSTAASSSTGSELDIVDTAAASDNFTTLVQAIEAAGLVPALQGDGPFTVFAPTDEAFDELPSSTLDTLLADPGGALTQILLYHVIPGQLLEQDLTDGLTAQTVEGRTVQFGIDRDSVTINDANLIVTDIKTSNGVIHVIDSVISPPVGAATSSGAAASNAAASNTASSNSASASSSNTASASAALASKLPVLSDVSSLSSEVNNGEVKVIYKTSSAIDEVADFYEEEMSRLDFRTTRSVITARAATLAFASDEGNVRIGVTEDASSDAVIVELTVTAP